MMDDLDALLADLESTTSHIKQKAQAAHTETPSSSSSHRSSTTSSVSPQQPQPPSSRGSTTSSISPQQQQAPSSHGSGSRGSSSARDTPPPLPPHPGSEDIYETFANDPQPIYEAQTVHNPQVTSVIREEKPQQRSALSHNLTELDSLLQDLSSAQFLAEVDRRSGGATYEELTVIPGGTPMGGATLPPPPPGVDQRLHNGNLVGQPSYDMSEHPPGAASSATAELDTLMASLSDFKVAEPPPPVKEEPPYAQPVKSPRPVSDKPDGGKEGSLELETMLGNLQSDMNRQGITTVPKGHCSACTKPIVGEVITALGKIWHPEHFVCMHCHEELGTRNFFEREGQPYCERDYHHLFSPKCGLCNGPILDKCVTALDKTWHPEHWVCAQCGRPFGDGGFHTRDGKAYCKEDYFEMFAPKCGGCDRPIVESYISALNKQWHPQCFACQECGVTFGTGSFFDHDGLPYCETHYHARRGSLCAGCNKPITGRCITAMYKKFHPEHFVCAFCLKQLNKGTFKENNDKPYCHPCFVKLFG